VIFSGTGGNEMRNKGREDLSVWIRRAIEDFAASPENSLRNAENEAAWAMPLVGFSRGSDPLYKKIKTLIGPFYREPIDVFKAAFPDADATADDLTVIAWILPQTRATRMESRKETQYPSERWARSRKFGEEFNVMLRTHVVAALEGAGYKAVAPQLSPSWAIHTSERYGIASSWSERHAAHISGLGTFGLCDGLITQAGKAMRCGSVVARINLQATERPYRDPHEYCLFLSAGECGKCMDRCPVGAITAQGHDKGKCRNYIDSVSADYIKGHYGLDIYGCGLCQTKVPCEARIPRATGRKKRKA
jgi:epoxyqueuosine reductase